MSKSKYCIICECEKNCKVFAIRKDSEAFEDLKRIFNSDKKQFPICEEHYPPEAVTQSKNGKILDKADRNHLPKLKIPKHLLDRYPQEAISAIEPIINVSVPEANEASVPTPNEVPALEESIELLNIHQTRRLTKVSKCEGSQRVQLDFQFFSCNYIIRFQQKRKNSLELGNSTRRIRMETENSAAVRAAIIIIL